LTFIVESQPHQQAYTTQLNDLMRGLSMYQRLGLFFERKGENHLVVRFTLLDPNDPNRVFCFSIRIHPETDAFIVEECQPLMDSLSNHVDQLNRTNDLSLFIRSMRKAFKQMV
jgi:hypothetical protein